MQGNLPAIAIGMANAIAIVRVPSNKMDEESGSR
jgi:hypothetical protein